MSVRHWSLPLLALAALVFAAPGPARADQQQYVVTYVELLPSGREHGAQLLDKLADAGIKAGAKRFSVDQEIQRSNFYVLIEIWPSEQTYEKFLGAATTKVLLAALEPFLEAPFDVRPGTLIETGVSGKAADRAGEVAIVTHIDVIPNFLDQARPLILDFVADSANDPGVKEFILVSWLDITNHFQLIERFQNMRAFDLHVSADHTVDFRNQLQPFIGAPYDERLYSTHP
jgi:quinol monooxygenase YgiN